MVNQCSDLAGYLRASLAAKKGPDTTWNIYVLQKKDTAAMYQQFDELSSSFHDTSPPMYHHLLCEGHTLLRSQLLLQPHPPPSSSSGGPCASPAQAPPPQTSELVSNLRKSCLAMALSLCRYNTGKADVLAAAKYLLLSKHKIRDVIQTFLSKFPRSASPPYSILLKYLELVVFDGARWEGGMVEAEPADTVLQLYAELRPQLLSRLLLNSWLHQAFTPDKALEIMATYLLSKSLRPNQM